MTCALSSGSQSFDDFRYFGVIKSDTGVYLSDMCILDPAMR
jgi:hypothetical protein